MNIDTPSHLKVYFTPDAIREHFEACDDRYTDFIAGLDEAALLEIGEVAYGDDALWDVFDTVLRNAADWYHRTHCIAQRQAE